MRGGIIFSDDMNINDCIVSLLSDLTFLVKGSLFIYEILQRCAKPVPVLCKNYTQEFL